MRRHASSSAANPSTGQLERVSRAADGTVAADGCFTPDPRDNGDEIAFTAFATNLFAPDLNGTIADAVVRVFPFAGASYSTGPSDPIAWTRSPNPLTFSVAGPVGPHTDGIGVARGALIAPPGFFGNPYALAQRAGSVLQALGLDDPPTPADVNDYWRAGVPSEAVLFESAPPRTPLTPAGAPPDRTNNQQLEPVGFGLAAGPGLMMLHAADPAGDADCQPVGTARLALRRTGRGVGCAGRSVPLQRRPVGDRCSRH